MDAEDHADVQEYAQAEEGDVEAEHADVQDSRPPLPWVVPKNPPKWDERVIDFAVAEHAHDLPVSVEQAMAARDTMVAVKGALWEAFRARGKPSKPRSKKEAAEPQAEDTGAEGAEPGDREPPGYAPRDPDDAREAKAKRVLRTLHRQLKDAITAKRYDRVPALVDRLGVVAKVLGRGVAE